MAYSQNDPTWKNIKIGFDTGPSDTIGNYGCYMAAIANVCVWAGNNLSPAQINDLAKQRGWLVSSDLIAQDDIPALLCDNLRFVSRTTWHDATPMNYFADASSPDVAYIICIDASKAAGIQTHFVMVWALNGPDDLIIDDSWDGVRKPLSHYGNPSVIIQSATKFIKVKPAPPVPVAIPVATPAPTPPPVPYVPPAAPVIADPAKKYDVLTTLMYFSSSQDATFHKDAKGVLESGEYFEFDTKDTTVQLGDNNMKPLYWINTKDNVVSVPQPASKPDPVAVAALDVATLFTPFPDGKSRRYIAQRDMYIYDLAAKDATGINIKQDAPVPIFGYLTNNGLTYLIPRLNADSAEGRVAPKKHYYGIPTTSVYTGLPGMMSQQYIDALKRAENENRIYRKSVGHETTDDRLYYAQQLIARSVSDGVRFLSEVIPLKRLKAMYSQKDKTKK